MDQPPIPLDYMGQQPARPRAERRVSRSFLVSLLIGTPAISAIGGMAAALTLSIRRGGLLLPLLVLPLLTPVVIFGAGAVLARLDRVENGAVWFLAAFSAVVVLLSPFVTAAALRLNLSE